jgi:hypothetical protein
MYQNEWSERRREIVNEESRRVSRKVRRGKMGKATCEWLQLSSTKVTTASKWGIWGLFLQKFRLSLGVV